MLVAAVITVASAVDYLARFAGVAARAPTARDARLPHRRQRADRRRAADRAARARRRGGRARPLGRRRRPSSSERGAAGRARRHARRGRARAGMAAATSSTTWPASTRCARATRRELFHVNVRGAEAAVRAAARAGVRARGAHVLGRVARARRRARRQRGLAAPRLVTCRSTSAPSTRARWRRSRRRARAGIESSSVNPSSVQGPGRAGGTGRILIAYLNGRLKVFVDTNISLVDIHDCVAGPPAGGRARRARRALRAQRRDADLARGAGDRVGHDRGRRDTPRFLPAAGRRGRRRRCRGRLPRARASTPPVCREMVRTMLHGHRYDGSRRARARASSTRRCARRSAARSSGRSTRGSSAAAARAGHRRALIAKPEAMERDDDRERQPQPERRPARAARRRLRRGPGPTDPPAHSPRGDARARLRARRRPAHLPDDEEPGRFSEGQEELPDTPEKVAERRFSEGTRRSCRPASSARSLAPLPSRLSSPATPRTRIPRVGRRARTPRPGRARPWPSALVRRPPAAQASKRGGERVGVHARRWTSASGGPAAS